MNLKTWALLKVWIARAIRVFIIVGLASASCSSVSAEDPQAAKVSDTISYVPSVSDLMIATIQPRHIRLWLAAQLHNWDFASYELGNMKGAFRRLGLAHPIQNDIPLQDMIASVTQQPIADLEKAIKAKDSVLFGKAYLGLTTACNSCHEAVNHGAVVIKVPSTGAEDDLDLSPANP